MLNSKSRDLFVIPDRHKEFQACESPYEIGDTFNPVQSEYHRQSECFRKRYNKVRP